jgi:ADP-ribose pyrophosphatase
MSPTRIVKRTESRVSPWVRLVAKEALMDSATEPQTYHCIAQADYVTIVARLPDGRLPIVRQFRPAVERDTWELPAGLLDVNESAELAAQRELLEETGARPVSAVHLGTLYPDTGRLENCLHVIGVVAELPQPSFVPEPGLSVSLVDPAQLRAMILAGDFNHQLHVGALAMAELKGFRTGVFS